MKWMLAALAAVVLSACAPHVTWTKPGLDQAQFQRDAAQCQYEGNKATATDPNMFAQLMSNNLAEQCMRARGYTQVRGEDDMARARAQAAANEKAHPIADQKAQQLRDLQSQS